MGADEDDGEDSDSDEGKNMVFDDEDERKWPKRISQNFKTTYSESV